MKNFNKKIYSLNLLNLKKLSKETNIPKVYFKLAYNIANSFSKDYAAIGVMNINDLIQEANFALLRSWRKIKWDYIQKLDTQEDRNKAINRFLSISIKGLLSDQIKMNLDGSGKPIKGIWNNEDKKRYATGFGFISVLFPQWFDTDALSIIEDEVYDYDYDKLGEYLDGWLEKYLPKHHRMFKMFYGLDDIYSKPKKISEIARFYGMKAQTVRKQKQRLLHRLRMHDTALNELAFYVSTNGIKSQSQVYDWAEINLKIFRD